MLTRRSALAGLAMLAVVSILVPDASAAILLNSKGWQITMPAWAAPASGAAIVEDPSGDPNVLIIQIFKRFQGSPGLFGEMPTIVMSFAQVSPDANTATKIVINDESVTNSTTTAWQDFHFILGQFGYASFNQAQTFPGDFGGDANQNFYLDQFTGRAWVENKPDLGDPTTWSQQLDLDNGVVPIGDAFNPGSLRGSLVIDVDLTTRDGSQALGFFTLKEYPTPEPATLAILAVGGLLALRRRRD